jgi:hypothetical protein
MAFEQMQSNLPADWRFALLRCEHVLDVLTWRSQG